MRNRILLLSQSLPPTPVGSAVIIGNLARQFSSSEMIVAGERPAKGIELVWKDEWPPLIHLVRGWHRNRRGRRWWTRLQFPLVVVRSICLAIRFRCTAVVAVFPKEEFLFAGYLTALATGAKFYPYFHNTYLEDRENGLRLRFAQWLQPRVFKRAQHVFVMSEGMVELFHERFPSLECSALVHSFNEDIPDFKPQAEVRSPLRIIISGNVNESCRDATVRVCEAISQLGDASLTLLSGSSREYLTKLGILREGVQYETVSREEVIGRLKTADIVILPHGFSGGYSAEEYRTIFPTRAIEYLICGRPILAHTPPDCYLTRFLRQHKCALIVEEPSISALLEAMERLRSEPQLRSDLVRSALQTAPIFHAPRVAATLRTRLQEKGYGFHPKLESR